jgi:hypothetical protein
MSKEKASLASTSYNTSHNGPNVRPLRLENGECANSNNRARFEYSGNSEHSCMRCLAVKCSITSVSDRQKEKSRQDKPSDLSEIEPIKVTKKGIDNDFALRPRPTAMQCTARNCIWLDL